MTQIIDLLARHGASVLFVAVFLEQVGVPFPAAPWLLAAGALAGQGRMWLLPAVAASVAACLLADTIWFYLGRYFGNRILGLLCRISLKPDNCARKTSNLFTRYGMVGILAAKFVPGLSALAAPMAGNSGVKISRFLSFDFLGSLLYAGVYTLLGKLFSHQLDRVLNALAGLGRSAIAVVLGLFALYLAFKFFQRQRLLHELKVARITVDELHEKLEAGEDLVILDLRPVMEINHDPLLIRGALHMGMDEIAERHQEIPRDREVILYCSCPNEVSSARIALQLHRQGIAKVRPLVGGIRAWRQRNYPVEARVALA